jgi:DNA-binding transcriptional ArsR family regulator
MGELVAGRPALRVETVVSLPLDMVSILSLLYRAVPGSNLYPWLLDARRQLPVDLRRDLDLLHGFSGRLLYYPEEPVMRFRPLAPDRIDCTFPQLIHLMQSLPASQYIAMAEHAVQRVHADLEIRWRPPMNEDDWRRVLVPALTTAQLDEVIDLLAAPAALKRRTIALYQGVWEHAFREEREKVAPRLHEAARRGAAFVERGFAEAYAALTGQRQPEVLERPSPSITRVAFCPSAHLGNFVSYIAYEPDLIVYFPAVSLIDRCQAQERVPPSNGLVAPPASRAELLEAARALADPTRLRMIDLLLEGELYAQEIVGRLGVAQSAVSRHLAQLERAGLVSVEARRGSKYYAVNASRLDALSAAIAARATAASGSSR